MRKDHELLSSKEHWALDGHAQARTEESEPSLRLSDDREHTTNHHLLLQSARGSYGLFLAVLPSKCCAQQTQCLPRASWTLEQSIDVLQASIDLSSNLCQCTMIHADQSRHPIVLPSERTASTKHDQSSRAMLTGENCLTPCKALITVSMYRFCKFSSL